MKIIFSEDFDWETVEEEIQAIHAAAPSHRQREIIPGGYTPGAWKYSTSAVNKRPCILCGKTEREMVYFRPSVSVKGVDILCMCISHYRQFKNHERTKSRYIEEKEKFRERMKQAALPVPNTPDAYQVEIDNHIDELNDILDTFRLTSPMVINSSNADALTKYKLVQELKPLVQSLIDGAKVAQAYQHRPVTQE